MYFERLLSMVRREVTRTMHKLNKPPRMGLVSSYDPQKHAVKVKFQPEGTESGWVPVTGHGVGNGFGRASAPNINDQVEVHFHEGDVGVSRIMTRHWSKVDSPPQLAAGEHADIHQQGQTIYHKSDGSLIIGGAGYTQTGNVGGGQSGNLGTGGETGETGQSPQQQQQQQPNAKQVIHMYPDGTMVHFTPNNNRIDNTPNNTHYITASASNVKVVKSSGNSDSSSAPSEITLPVMLIDGSAALVLWAQPKA